MTIENDDDLQGLKAAGQLVARTLEAMGKALEPGITTRELDELGRRLLELEGARSAPELTYNFPGATCISVGPDCAHGIPDDRKVARRRPDQYRRVGRAGRLFRRHRRQLRRSAHDGQDRTSVP